MIPTIEQITSLHRKYAPNDTVFDLVFIHCQIVSEIAEQIIDNKNLSVDRTLVQAGALLHDIGGYTLIDLNKEFDEKNYIKHGIIGYQLLMDEGIDERLCEIARRHTGVGISEKQIIERSLPLPPMDYFARTREERLVMYADKFHSKTPRFNSYEKYQENIRRFGDNLVIKFRELAEEFGIPDLRELSKKYNHPIV